MLLELARAEIHGGKKYPRIRGTVNFRQTNKGVLITSKIYNLPYEIGKCNKRIFGFHIHEGTECSGNSQDEFANAKSTIILITVYIQHMREICLHYLKIKVMHI